MIIIRFSLIIICVLFNQELHGQEIKSKVDSLKKVYSFRDITVNKEQRDNHFTNNDTLLQNNKILLDSKNEKTYFEFIFPSIIALLVSFIGFFGNLYANKKQLENSNQQFKIQLSSSKETLKNQIDTSKEIIQKQIDSTKEIAYEQINASKQTADLVFRQNVLSVNRQNWINNFRDVISKISSSIIIPVFQKYDCEKLEDMIALITKAELMLNPNDKRDQELINNLQEYQVLLLTYPNDLDKNDLYKKRGIIINMSKTILKSEWERVKRGD